MTLSAAIPATPDSYSYVMPPYFHVTAREVKGQRASLPVIQQLEVAAAMNRSTVLHMHKM